MENFKVRKALESDAALIIDVGRRTFFDAYAKDNTPENMKLYLDDAFSAARVLGELRDPRKIYFLAFEGAAEVGYAALADVPPPSCVTGARPVELHKLYVDQKVTGRGAAPLLLETCIAEARRLGYRTIWLGVWERAARARAFYKKWGFQDAGDSTYRVGNDVQPDKIMCRQVIKS